MIGESCRDWSGGQAEGEGMVVSKFREVSLMACTVILIEASRSDVSAGQQNWLRLT
jgi:hypothetical protein